MTVTDQHAPQPNRYAGPCSRCGSRIPAGAGTYNRITGAQHTGGQCKTTTKTYRDTIARERMTEHRAAVEAIYAEAGYRYDHAHRIECADIITGNGLHALVGGYDRGQVMPNGVRVYRRMLLGQVSDLIRECPEPRFQTGDFFADGLNRARALVAILDGLRCPE